MDLCTAMVRCGTRGGLAGLRGAEGAEVLGLPRARPYGLYGLRRSLVASLEQGPWAWPRPAPRLAPVARST